MAWLPGILGAVILGAAGNLTYELAKHQTVRVPKVLMRHRELPTDVRAFDSTQLGLYPLVTWSRKRRLEEAKLRTTYVGRSTRPHLFDRPEWHEAVKRERLKGTAGSTAYLVGVDIDHGEHPAAFEAGLLVAESDYAECMATLEIARSGGASELTAALRADLPTLSRLPTAHAVLRLRDRAGDFREVPLPAAFACRAHRAGYVVSRD
ncbi:hypothetical protein [Amycolatopsis keratiniphila]|uniref:hypothetical protein n=1 Tax=Amycolatopsis keratiniphila TaxID=129921 RepID=UPI00087BCEA6|nr:hypothetical protein [Amycolatopsis keratiniphila]OLZ51848.1 hypothetical protein BS330_24655 [Amycolatopsis keratiniphila subsp. nogabecina]SDU62515.1 hypothetical protein SAMN04489733_7231 [Amycolatopsis keratiniphila]